MVVGEPSVFFLSVALIFLQKNNFFEIRKWKNLLLMTMKKEMRSLFILLQFRRVDATC